MTKYKTCPVDDCCGGTIIRDNGMRAKCRTCGGSGVVDVPGQEVTPSPCDTSELEAERARCADLTSRLNRERELRILAETRAQRDREMCEASSSDYIALRKEAETLKEQLDDAVKVANAAEKVHDVGGLAEKLAKAEKRIKNQTNEIKALAKTIKTLEDYGRLGVTTHFHAAVVKELDAAASVLKVERFHVAKWVKRAVDRYAKCSNKECLFGTIRSHYDQDCIVHEERPCSVCNSNEIKFEQVTCSYCEGSGWVARDEQCKRCFGKGTRDA